MSKRRARLRKKLSKKIFEDNAKTRRLNLKVNHRGGIRL